MGTGCIFFSRWAVNVGLTLLMLGYLGMVTPKLLGSPKSPLPTSFPLHSGEPVMPSTVFPLTEGSAPG